MGDGEGMVVGRVEPESDTKSAGAEIRAAKVDAEKFLNDAVGLALKEFLDRTGMCITGMSVNIVTHKSGFAQDTWGKATDSSITLGVKVEIE